MNPALAIAIGAAAAALGLWLLLPRGGTRGSWLGAALLAGALGALFVVGVPRVGEFGAEIVLWTLTLVTVGGAVATIATSRPVYSAIWFAVVLLATSGLLVFQGAQFLGMATIVVYAGAILVTFLFVLMLATPLGTAVYDRLSWESFLAGIAGAALVGFVAYLLGMALPPAGAASDPAIAAERADDILAPAHVAHLGENLFSTHLLAVEVAGTLLLVGLVGAVAIAAHDHTPPRRGAPAVNGRAGGPA